MERLESVPGEIAALRADMNARFAEVRADVAGTRQGLRDEMDLRFDAVHQVLISLQSQMADMRRQMLVLHEDVIERIKTIGERRH